MTSKRILFVITTLEIGGAERQVSQITVELKKRGWDPEVFAFWPCGPLRSILLENGIPVHGVVLPGWLTVIFRNERLKSRIGLVLSALRLLPKLWRRRPDIIHFFLPAAYIVGGMTSLLSPVPVRIMSRRSLRHYQEARPLFASIERWLHPHMTMICGNSQAVLNELKEEGIPPQRLRLIYNGIDALTYAQPLDRELIRARHGIPVDALVFVIVANLIPYKGHADLIAAFSSIQSRLPDPWLLLCLGRDDGILGSLREQAEAGGIDDNIRFLGSRTNVPDFLRLADVGVLCSHEEGFSNAILEGMAAGLPMVVTNVGGNAEAVLDGETGRVVPPKNPALLAQALLEVATDPERSKMGRKGRQRVEALFSLNACIDAYESLYQE